MEDVSAQIASPVFVRHSFDSPFGQPHPVAKKRSLPFVHQQQQKPSDVWNPKLWEWDSLKFVARPVPSPAPVQAEVHGATGKADGNTDSKSVRGDKDFNGLSLNLRGAGADAEVGNGCHSSLSSPEEVALSRSNKRVRSGSPGGGVSYPMCQVDNCKEDLTNAKDYHRRHKVCEAHSKAVNALVSTQMQRFCQQCSRFHPLSEFDEGKRSCRRRLAGHNRRRRKTMPEDANSRVVLPGNCESNSSADLNVVNLLAALAHVQGKAEDKDTPPLLVPDKDRLLQILSKINTLPLPQNLAKVPLPQNLAKVPLPMFQGSSVNMTNQLPNENQRPVCVDPSRSTKDLLAVLSASPVPVITNNFESQPDTNSRENDSDKTSSAFSDQATCLNLQNKETSRVPYVADGYCTSKQSEIEDSDHRHVHGIHPDLPLQLFTSSTGDYSPPKWPASRNYYSSESSNPSVERSPSSSPPVAQKLFPMHTLRGVPKSRGTSLGGVGNAYSGCCNTSLQLSSSPTLENDTNMMQNLPYQAGYTSSSGSDHSPASLNSGTQDRTGRIIFKLFDKDPSQLPVTLRTQVHNWLLNSPSDMESYIRPGCVVLTLYISMSLDAWNEFDQKLISRVESLIGDLHSDFWRNGRFLVCSGKQLALHADGKLRLFRHQKGWDSLNLISVSPLAVVSGEETSLLLKGRNLALSGNKIICSHTADYTIKEVSGPSNPESTFDEISLSNFKVQATNSSNLGRCFIEVENGLRGSSFPLIIADKAICQEIRLLEYDISDDGVMFEDDKSADLQHASWKPVSRDSILHFLNELGWLFQLSCNPSDEPPDFKINRFKYLFIFSVEHDFCALVKSLLDILLEINLCREELESESLEMLSDIHLLNRAVQRKCCKMVDLLINYSVIYPDDHTKKYIFPPNLVGPSGFTPLHLAACTSMSENMVDVLTGDPQEIGLQGWSTLLDASGISPCTYAAMRNNDSYNKLVAQKLNDRKSCQVSVSIRDEVEPLSLEVNPQENSNTGVKERGQQSCSKCVHARTRYNRRMPGSQGLLQRPYIHSMLAVAAICVCVCLLLRGEPDIGTIAPFAWENLDFGSW